MDCIFPRVPRAWLVGLALALVPAVVSAQGSLTEAQRLRDTGQYAEAAAQLRAVLAGQPDNGDAARLLAQTLYWLKDVPGSRAAYESALARHPEDTTLRLQFARMLAETGQRARAKAIARPLQDVPGLRVEADALLGTIAYWDGDLLTARRLFRNVLQADPSHGEARRQLDAIEAASRPWVRLSGSVRHDDQPMTQFGVGVELGLWATPLALASVRVEPLTYRLPGAINKQFWSTSVSVSNYAAAAHLETDAGGGLLQRPEGAGLDWQGHVGAGIRGNGGVSVRGRIERTAYLSTTSSITTPLMLETATALLHLDNRGWLGEGALQRQRFPDANDSSTAYAWLLAPLVHRSSGDLQIGYAFSASNAAESRFVLDRPVQPYPPSDPRFNLAGHYVPYYTPSNMVIQSAVGAIAVHPTPGFTFRLSGSAPLRATDDAPLFVVVANKVQRTTYARRFSPWSARSSIDVAGRNGVVLSVGGEMGQTAFYTWAGAEIGLTFHLASTPVRRDTRRFTTCDCP